MQDFQFVGFHFRSLRQQPRIRDDEAKGCVDWSIAVMAPTPKPNIFATFHQENLEAKQQAFSRPPSARMKKPTRMPSPSISAKPAQTKEMVIVFGKEFDGGKQDGGER